eukprot:TRINITY_DN13274_c0_g1_i2.p1 TRINITY_DN13274_c0_g1~~TRINITY_DN13274_c0_g1_i2.p1  ORF type:complete len:317 (+),score=81.18 TRINITY_DN13274_c0_g1_i2:278-1228(+)
MVFFLAGPEWGALEPSLLHKISELGGLVTPFLSDYVTHVVVNKDLVKESLKELKGTKGVVIDYLYIEEVHKKGCEVDIQKYVCSLDSYTPQDIVSLENTEWTGVLTTKECKYPFVLTIYMQQMNLFWGKINWPTRANSTTKVSGTLEYSSSQNNIVFTENQIISSSNINEIQIPCCFKGVISDGTIKGNSTNGPFSLVFTQNIKAIPLPWIATGSSFEGKATIQKDLLINITSRKHNQLKGTATWPDNPQSHPLKGTISPQKLQINISPHQAKEIQLVASGDWLKQVDHSQAEMAVSGSAVEGDGSGVFVLNFVNC